MNNNISGALMEGEPTSRNRDDSSDGRQTPERGLSEGVEGSIRERQVHKRSEQGQSEGVDGSLRERQVHKRSYNLNSQSPSREVSRQSDGHRESRHQNSATLTILSSSSNKDGRRYEAFHYGRQSSQRSRPPRPIYKRSRYDHSRSRKLSYSSEDEVRETRRGRRRSYSDNEGDLKHIRKRRRQRSRSRRPRSNNVNNNLKDMPSDDRNILYKFLDILSNVKGSSTFKLSLTNVLPEFDPTSKDQTIVTWLTKIEECAEIYGWDEREVIHFAVPKLTGIAKTWYQGLDTVLYSWSEWKRKLIESFPCRDDYAELLAEMLAKGVLYEDLLEHYCYSKINLINRCGIKGRKAVDCLLHGIEDRAIRVGAQAAQFREPEDVLKYLKTVKPGHSRETSEKAKSERNGQTHMNKSKPHDSSSQIKCHNCNENGHKSFRCGKPPINVHFAVGSDI